MKRTKKKNVMVRAMLAAFVLIFSLAFAGTAMASEYVSGTASDVQDPNADRLFTVSGSWTKYEPCAELNIPMERLQSSIIAAKKTGHDPMVIWTSEKLNAEEEAVVLNSLKGNPGAGNPKSVIFVNGNEYDGYRMHVSLENECVSFERPSSWALIWGGTYEIVYTEISTEPEDPATDTDSGDVTTDTDTAEPEGPSTDTDSGNVSTDTDTEETGTPSTDTDSGDRTTDTDILDPGNVSTDTDLEETVPGPETSEPETPPTDTNVVTGTDSTGNNNQKPSDPTVPARPGKPSVSGDSTGSMIEEHQITKPVIKNDSSINDPESLKPHKAEIKDESKDEPRVLDDQPKTGRLPEYYVWLVLSLVSALVLVFKAPQREKHAHTSANAKKHQ